jgi:hypothetical protein
VVCGVVYRLAYRVACKAANRVVCSTDMITAKGSLNKRADCTILTAPVGEPSSGGAASYRFGIANLTRRKGFKGESAFRDQRGFGFFVPTELDIIQALKPFQK